ncbi:MAG: molecular chaperone DnaJ [Pseudomonadota bacterium]
MSKADYYELLGVARDADAAAVKSAFRKAAMKYHPDRNPGDAAAEQKFKELNEAYEVLKDDQRRAAYDRYGHAAFENGGGGANGFAQGFAGSSFADVFDDLFGEFMGARGGRGRGAGRGADLRYNLDISLEEAFAGKKATIEAPGSVACETCTGTGAKPDTQPVACPTCNGAGKVRATQGFFTIERTCPTCGGQGRVIQDPCEVCDGAGRVQQDRTLSVDVPPGVEDGTRIRLSGEGDAGARGGPAGDLYIFISVAEHDLFERDGPDLYCVVPVSMVRAALGCDIEAPTIDGGKVSIKIPEGVQTGKRFRMRGKGMSVLRSEARGDLYVELQVETPIKLTGRQKELLKEFAEEGGEEACPQSKGFFDRARTFWDNVTEGH